MSSYQKKNIMSAAEEDETVKGRKIIFRKYNIDIINKERNLENKYKDWLPHVYQAASDLTILFSLLKKEGKYNSYYNKFIFRDDENYVVMTNEKNVEFRGDDDTRQSTMRAYMLMHNHSRYFHDAILSQKCKCCNKSKNIIWTCAVRDCQGRLQRIYVYVIPILWDIITYSSKETDMKLACGIAVNFLHCVLKKEE